ncbi:MAG: phosphatidylinositol-specific phospholipase C/glycerophosphodiester phosphodiesterase family protein [Dermatophilaceae bacterium]
MNTRRILATTLGSLLLLGGVGIAPADAAAHPGYHSHVQPLERAHAHNDYDHDRPLLDALDHGFTSVEADVWLVDGELYIGHDAPDLTRTLRSTYLDPLADRVHANRGRVYPRWRESLRLLVDVKSEGAAAWPVLEAQLREYRFMMSSYQEGRVRERAVTAVVSGNRDLPAMQAARTRWSFYDGRLTDLGGPNPTTLMPLVSDNWTRHFSWQGAGEMPTSERMKLRQIVATAHSRGQQVRFWATPDLAGPEREAVWRELVAADVDVLNTDDLPGLQEYLLAEDPREARAA